METADVKKFKFYIDRSGCLVIRRGNKLRKCDCMRDRHDNYCDDECVSFPEPVYYSGKVYMECICFSLECNLEEFTDYRD